MDIEDEGGDEDMEATKSPVSENPSPDLYSHLLQLRDAIATPTHTHTHTNTQQPQAMPKARDMTVSVKLEGEARPYPSAPEVLAQILPYLYMARLDITGMVRTGACYYDIRLKDQKEVDQIVQCIHGRRVKTYTVSARKAGERLPMYVVLNAPFRILNSDIHAAMSQYGEVKEVSEQKYRQWPGISNGHRNVTYTKVAKPLPSLLALKGTRLRVRAFGDSGGGMTGGDGGNRCYNCGEAGHFRADCRKAVAPAGGERRHHPTQQRPAPPVATGAAAPTTAARAALQPPSPPRPQPSMPAEGASPSNGSRQQRQGRTQHNQQQPQQQQQQQGDRSQPAVFPIGKTRPDTPIITGLQPHKPHRNARYPRRRLIENQNLSLPSSNSDVEIGMLQIDVPEDLMIPTWRDATPRAWGTPTASTPTKRGGGRSPSALEAEIASRVKRIRTDTDELIQQDEAENMGEPEEGEATESSPDKGSSSSLLTSLLKISSTTATTQGTDTTCARVRSYSGESRAGKR